MNNRYCLISPVRNEEAYMRRTLDSVIAQSVPPALWVVVDDGSTDATPDILREYAANHPWIRIVQRADRGARKVGGGVIEAFNDGWAVAKESDCAFLCKLDMDLDLPPRYFELLIARMADNPRLGTCSGKPYFPGPSNVAKDFSGHLISEGCGDESSIGASKFYRRTCFEEIGGFVSEVMWDAIDSHRCRQLGWISRSYDDQPLRFVHLRPMGSSDRGIITGRKRHGRGQWFMGSHPIYFLATAVYRMTRRPFVTGGLAMMWGYIHSAFNRVPRYPDPAFRRFVRRYQLLALTMGKARAIQRIEEEHAPLWTDRTSGAV